MEKNNPNYKNATIEVNCSNCNKKFKILKCNTVNSNKAQKQNLYCSKKCKSEHQKEILKGESNPNYGNGCRIKGKLNPNYNFTKTYEERVKGRLYTDYYNWRNLIFEKYNYTCQCCNKQGGTLAAHHLDGYNKFKEKRTDINNGTLLCSNCHKEFHKIYGYGNNTLEQFKEFYKNKTGKEFEVAGF
ncbi:HNH endonuclease [Clostridium perfringens]|uniref:HNH endonuclease n=1 Tax=Clostridium perfringens TaxID=1502 RepID=UPI00338E4B03|nr:HNH endonuclease [Clostridium perfringens]